MADKVMLVLIQDSDNIVRRVRIGGVEIPVINASPVLVPGAEGAVITVSKADIDITVEKVAPQA